MTGQTQSFSFQATNRVNSPIVNASTANVSILNVSQINISSITLNTFNVSQVNASSIDGDLIVADEMVVLELEAVTGAIDELTTIDLFTDVLYVREVNASNLSCVNASMAELEAGEILCDGRITTVNMSATTISSTTLQSNQIFTPLLNTSYVNASELFVRFGAHFDGAVIIRNNLEVDNSLTAGDIISNGVISGSNICMTGQTQSFSFKATNRVNTPTMNASVLNGSSLNVSGVVNVSQVNAYAVSITELLEAGDIVCNGNSSLTNISATTIHSTNISGVNGSFTYLTADNLQETLIAGPGIAIANRIISTQQILVAGTNIDIIGEVISTTSLLNISNVSSEKGKIVNLSCTNLSATSITASNVQPTLIAGSNLTLVGNVINTSSNLNISNVSAVSGFIDAFEADTIETIGLISQGIVSDEADIETVRAISVDTNTLICLTGGITNLSSTNISGARGTITNFSSTNSSATRGTITNISCSNLSVSNKVSLLNVSGTNATFTSLTANNVQPTLIAGSNLTLVGNVINTSSNLNISNVSAVSGFIDAFEADTIETIGLISQGIVSDEADIETVRAISVDTNTLICLTGGITNLSSTNISATSGTITNFSSTNSSATRGTITNISCSNISCSLKINVLNVSGTNATFTSLTANNVQPTLTAGTGITIVGTTISSSATLVAGTNIDITSGVIKTTSNVNLSNLSTDVLHSPVIVSNLITSIDGEIDILNADISVTTPFLAATNISGTNATFTNLSVANEIHASIVNASTIIAEDAFSVLSSTLSTSFYTDFVDDQKFLLKVTGVSGSFSTAPAPTPKLAFRTGTTDALLINQSSNVSIGNHLTVTNTSGTNASFTNLTANNVQPLLTAGSGITIANNVISAGASALTGGLNISILNNVVSTTSNFSASTLYVTGNSTVGPVLNIGLNDNSTTPKTIYFGGMNGDNEYNHTVIESRIHSGTENAELLIFKGNDVNADRIRLRAAIILFDTYPAGTTNRTAENIRMMINSAGRVGIGTVNPTRPLQVVGDIYCTGNISCEGYVKGNDKPRMRIVRDNFTLPSGTTSLLNGGTVSLRENCTVTAGVFIATIPGVYACSCKVRLPDSNLQSPEIQWYRRASNGTQTAYENLETWIPAGVSGRRSGMSHTIIDLTVGNGILPRNDLETMAGCFATFDVFMIN
jgi:hypothetical protein